MINYKSYVGPEENYDLMAGLMFVRMFQVGLRSYHTLLDVGCGSLRGGKLFIPYLDVGNYYGIEPLKELVIEGIKNEIGEAIIEIKRPHFVFNSEFDVSEFPLPAEGFDFILAQSIFSHTPFWQLKMAFTKLSQVLKKGGIFVATYVKGNKDYSGEKWVYPKCVTFTYDTIKLIAKEVGLHLKEMNGWFHPSGQTWIVMSNNLSSRILITC